MIAWALHCGLGRKPSLHLEELPWGLDLSHPGVRRTTKLPAAVKRLQRKLRSMQSFGYGAVGKDVPRHATLQNYTLQTGLTQRGALWVKVRIWLAGGLEGEKGKRRRGRRGGGRRRSRAQGRNPLDS